MGDVAIFEGRRKGKLERETWQVSLSRVANYAANENTLRCGKFCASQGFILPFEFYFLFFLVRGLPCFGGVKVLSTLRGISQTGPRGVSFKTAPGTLPAVSHDATVEYGRPKAAANSWLSIIFSSAIAGGKIHGNFQNHNRVQY